MEDEVPEDAHEQIEYCEKEIERLQQELMSSESEAKEKVIYKYIYKYINYISKKDSFIFFFSQLKLILYHLWLSFNLDIIIRRKSFKKQLKN